MTDTSKKSTTPAKRKSKRKRKLKLDFVKINCWLNRYQAQWEESEASGEMTIERDDLDAYAQSWMANYLIISAFDNEIGRLAPSCLAVTHVSRGSIAVIPARVAEREVALDVLHDLLQAGVIEKVAPVLMEIAGKAVAEKWDAMQKSAEVTKH